MDRLETPPSQIAQGSEERERQASLQLFRWLSEAAKVCRGALSLAFMKDSKLRLLFPVLQLKSTAATSKSITPANHEKINSCELGNYQSISLRHTAEEPKFAKNCVVHSVVRPPE